MKIDLLLELVQPKVAEKKFNGYMRDGNRSSHKEVGRGLRSSVKHDATDPHMVRKHNHETFADYEKPDGFNQFINYLIENDLLDNPHFPRVYNITKVTGQNDKHIYTYKMEKLVSGVELNGKEIDAVIHQNFQDWAINVGEDHYNREALWVRKKLNAIESVLTTAVHQKDYRKLKSETLIEACQILHNMLKHYETDLDLNIGNFMFRRTGVGLQLVITDPIF